MVHILWEDRIKFSFIKFIISMSWTQTHVQDSIWDRPCLILSVWNCVL